VGSNLNLGYAKNAPSGNNKGNTRTGNFKKKVKVNPEAGQVKYSWKSTSEG
jgi:hypothetical protein